MKKLTLLTFLCALLTIPFLYGQNISTEIVRSANEIPGFDQTYSQVSFPLDNNSRMVACDGVLTNYTNTPSGGGPTSQDFADFPSFTNQAADDFVVPLAGDAIICQIDITGTTAGTGTGLPGDPANLVFMEIYDDAAGLPGTLLFSESFLGTVVDPDGDGIFSLTPTAVPNLTAGSTYWLSVYAEMTFACCGQWFWDSSAAGNGNAYAWRNPLDGFGTGCVVWTDGGLCIGNGPDLSMDISFNASAAAPIAECATDTPKDIPAGAPGTTSGPMDDSIIAVTETGTVGTDYEIDFVSLDLTHTFDADLDITLESPDGTILELSTDNGGSGDNYTGTVFQDGGADITAGTAPFTGIFEPEGGPMNVAFAGDNVFGDWTLHIIDDVGGDFGELIDWCIEMIPLGAPPAQVCGVPLGQGIPDGAPGTTSGPMIPSVATVADCGQIGTNYMIDSIDLDLNHTFDGDLDITLTSPAGTVLDLSLSNGGAGDDYTGTIFMDGNPSITTGTPPYTGTFEPEGGPMNVAFAGENIEGDWTLNIVDNFGGDSGVLNNFCINYSEIAPNLPPAFLACPGDSTIPNGPGQCGAVVVLSPPVALDPEDGVLIGVQIGGPPSGTLFPVGPNLITFEVTDSCGLTDTCSFTITVEDVEDPVAVCADYTAQLDASGSVTISAGDVEGGSTDNCGVTSMTVTPDTFTCADVGPNTVTLTVFDAAGNSNSCTATVTVEDNVAPTAVCATGGSGPVTTTATSNPGVAIPDNTPGGVSDVLNVVDSVVITDLDVNLNITHTWVGDIIVTLESPGGTVVTIYDQPGVPDSTFGCAGDDVDAVLDDEAGSNVEDECGGGVPTIDGSFIPNNALSAFDGENTVGNWILTISDNAAGDTGTLNSWGITYSSAGPPGGPIDVYLDANGDASITPGDIDDGSSDACGIASMTVSPDTFTCADVGINIVTLTVTDVNGNVATCTSEVNIIDNIPPVAICQDITVQLDGSGTASITPGDIDNGSNDACGVDTLSLDIDTFDCADVGFPVVVTLTVTDVNGNSSTCTATVTVEDNVPPEIVCPADIVVENDPGICGAVVDYEGGAQSIIFSETFTNGVPSSDCGVWNTFQSQLLNGLSYTSVTFSGSNDPVGITMSDPAKVLQLADALRTNASVTIVDGPNTWRTGGCGGGTELSVNQGICSCNNPGYSIRPCIGNSNWGGADTATCGGPTQTLTLEFVHGVGGGPIVGTDNCPGSTTVQTVGLPSGSVFPVGTTTNTFVVTDASGNTATCSFDVTVNDTEPPLIACPPDASVSTDPGQCSAVVIFPDALALDNCDVDTVIQTAGLPSGSAFPLGVSTVEFTATDIYGNSSVCSFTITVSDNEDPVAVCQDITIELDEFGDASISPAQIDNGSTDNCGIDFMTLDITDFDCDDVGDNIVTLTVFDENGNSSQCTAIVTVEDNIAPVLICEGEPATVSDTVSDSPALPIPDGDPAGISTTLTVADDFEISDLDVHLDISHTWVGDLIVTLESPAGTSVTIVDRMGVPASTFGCAEDDLQVTLDDEASDPIEDECSGSPITGSFIPNNALDAFDGESTVGDWILTVSDNATPDPGVINEWGITYSYNTSGAPYVVELDANGMATVDVSDLVNVTEACGWTATIGGGGGGAPGSITTLFGTNNGGDPGGAVYFDITVGAEDLELLDIDTNTSDVGALTMDVYTLVGSYVGNETDPGAWTLQTSGSGTGAGLDNPSNIVLDSSIMLSAGESYGMALVFTSASAHSYTNGDGSNEDYDNGDLALSLGAASNVPFTAPLFSPRVWNGSLNYFVGSAPSTTIDFTCDDLGLNEIEITVTDDSGNTATCTATVEVLDVTSPVIVCEDVTIELDEDGVVEIDPMDLIANSPSTYNVITISNDNGAGEGFTDFTVDVTAADTVSFDWDYTTVDGPAFDSFGYLLNGVYTELTDPAGANDQSGNSGPINVAPGDVFGFRSYSLDGLFGACTTTISNFVPGFTGQFDPANWVLDLINSDGDAFFVEIPGGPLAFDACGITIWAVDVTEVTCDDIGTPIVITVFVSDDSGNIASCQSTVTVVDLLGPEVVCPADQTQDPGPGNLYWEVPDYWANGEATATDNCTDPVVVTSQDPAPGTLLPDGVYTVTICAEDEYMNETCCTFELTIESVLGIDDNDINFSSIIMYPNPARDIVNLNNPQSLALDQAQIFDLTGRLVQSVDLRNMGTDIAIDISHLASATYMVLINGENGHITKQLIKE